MERNIDIRHRVRVNRPITLCLVAGSPFNRDTSGGDTIEL